MRAYKLIPALLTLFLIACSSASITQTDSYEAEGYEEYENQGNPYSVGTGHYAGYEWAERTGGSCNGNSDSFNEGCEMYYELSE